MWKNSGKLILVICGVSLLSFGQGPDAGKVPDRPKSQSTPNVPKSGKGTTPNKSNRNRVDKPLPSWKKDDSVRTAQLQVFVRQTGVKVFVDEVAYDTETSPGPFIFDSLIPGSYTIRVEKQGYQTETQTIKLTAKQKAALNFNLVLISGSLEIKTNYSDAVIEIDQRIFSGQVRLNLTEGQYPYRVSKKGYKTTQSTAVVTRGQTNVQTVVLERFTADEYLKEANNHLMINDYENALAASRRVLSMQPDNTFALSISAASYEKLGFLSASFPYYSLLLNKGESVTLPIRFSKKSNLLETGKISLQKGKVIFQTDANVNQVFSVNAYEIQELKLEKAYIQVKGNISNGQKQKKDTYYFDAQDSAFRESLFKLLQQIKTGISLQENGFGVVYLPSDRFKRINEEGFSFEVPENWIQFFYNSQNTGKSIGYAPKGGFERNSKGLNYSHGVSIHSVILTPPITNTPQLIANNAINLTLRSYPKAQKITQLQEIQINGKEVFTLKVQNTDHPRAQTDLVNFYVFISPTNRLLLITTVVPVLEERDYHETIEHIVRSLLANNF